jgi:large subunit ribosomal protein L9
MAAQVLLKKDVDSLGRKGEIVVVRPGYARNYLIPEGLAIVADKAALRLQVRLQEEREKQSVIDRSESEAIASRIEGTTVVKIVKVDHDGHMYGSVSIADIIHLIQDATQVELEKRCIQLKHPIKTTGIHPIEFKLKEGIVATCNLKVISEEAHRAESEAVSAE